MFLSSPVRTGVDDLVAPDGGDIENLARSFMREYADDVRNGRRQAIANRYDKRGAYRVGEGRKNFETWQLIHAAYMSEWNPPKHFAWKDLSYEALGRDSVMIVGLFDWGLADGTILTFSYTGLMLKTGRDLKIRLEDESILQSRGQTLSTARS